MSDDTVSIKDRMESATLRFDAFNESPIWSIFEFAVDGKEIPVAIIKSEGIGLLRIFRGIGEKVAQQRPQNIIRLFDSLCGKKMVYIARLTEGEGKVLDFVNFKAQIQKEVDAKVYGHLMETIKVKVVSFQV